MGAANPIEWVLPPVAITHEIVAGGAALAGSPKTAKMLAAPGSALAGAESSAPQPTLGTPITPPTQAQNAQEEEASRRRATEARLRLGESGRASDQLTRTGSLG